MPNLVVSESASLDVQVVSAANPEPHLLRSIRQVIPQNENVLEIFRAARRERTIDSPMRVDRQRLHSVLAEAYPEEEGIGEVAEYLADEFEQIGDDGILLISPETGRAIARVTDDSFYEAAPVPRESGSMVERGFVIRPDVEAFLAYWAFETDREKDLRFQMLGRINQTELQREEGDPRTLILSREGRRTLAQMVQDQVGEAFRNPRGAARAVLDFFPIGEPLEGVAYESMKIVPWSRVRRRVQDVLAVNTKYDALTATLAAVTASWARSIVSTLLTEAAPRVSSMLSWDIDFATAHNQDGVWFAEPNLARALMDRNCRVFTAQGPENIAIYLTRKAGYLEVNDDKIGTNHREVHDRWTVESATEMILHISWESVRVVRIQGDFSSWGVELTQL